MCIILCTILLSSCARIVQPKTKEALNKQQEAWFSSAEGNYMDPDRSFGFQCVDVIDDYCIALFGDYVNSIGLGNAGTLFKKIPSNSKYFTKISYNPNKPNIIPKHGDVIEWVKHIAVVDSATADTITVLQQNRGGRAIDPCERFTFTDYKDVIGWLRPKIKLS
jgi:hypothetical protein